PGAAPPMPSADAVYTVQVLWDETMASTAAAWVSAADDRAMVILAGNGHCHDSAIVRRVSRRGVTPVVSVRPIIDDGEGNVAEAIGEAMNDYLFVMTMPVEPHAAE
ncbi:MAG: ChaN family lipoprotein, partial [Kofleriaceae bacterium]|nr:ChaN family lipoprotein [Kofleriaceae bacterium]